MKKKFSIVSFIVFLLIPLIVGFLSYYLTKDNMAIYDVFNKPAFSPPSWVFPPVWTALYILMGIGSYLVYKNSSRLGLLFTYFLSLFANFFWPIVFFLWNEFGFAFIWLLLLFILTVAYTVDFLKVSKTAAIIQIPYILWLIVAGYLNFFVWQLNK